MPYTEPSRALVSQWPDAWLLAGVRTPFIDYTQAFALVSPIDLGIKAAREALARAGVSPGDVGTVIASSMAQTSYDAFLLPRHIGVYAGVPNEVPAHLVQRVCGSGIEIIGQAADTLMLGRASLALCAGAESMSRNPIAAYTHRAGFRLGKPVEFKDFLWEALLDTSVDATMGGTAENLARRYDIRRPEVDAYAARSFERALQAQASGFLAGEICAVQNETFEVKGLSPRGLKLSGKETLVDRDTHIRATPLEALARIRPAFGGVQTGGNSSAIVDGGAAVLVGSGDYVKRHKRTPLARIVACVAVGVPAEIMGIGPVASIRALLAATGKKLSDIDRIEINEAFGAQVLACVRELGIDQSKLNVNGGAIAIGHPLGASGVRLVLTLARELQRSGLRYGIASACIGGGQGIAMLIERERVMLTVTREVRIEWGDCDPAGIVYFPRYFEYFDHSTAALFEAVGYRKPQLLQAFDIAGFPLVDVRASFRLPSKFGEDVLIQSTIPEWRRSSFKVHHRLMKGAELAVEGFETRVWAGHDPERPGGIRAKPLPQDLFERFRHA